MAVYSSFEAPFEYSENDQYIRAIRNYLLRRNGEVKAGAFKSHKGGVSVTRTNMVLLNFALSYMNAHFEGEMAIFPEKACKEACIYEKHSPSPGHNIHHWELYGDPELTELTEEQIDALIDSLIFPNHFR